MSKIDIRDADVHEVTQIVFADEKSSDGCFQACEISNYENGRVMGGYFIISDSDESIIINSKEHAQNLIKALNKAIELGWVK